MQYGPMGDPQRGQGKILVILKVRPEISQKDLSSMLDMRPQSLGEFLAKLEKNGYIARTPSETDHRVVNIKLTEKGRAVTEQEFSYDKIFDCLSEEKQVNLSNYFSRIIETFVRELGEEPPEPVFGPCAHDGRFSDGHFHGYSHRRKLRRRRRR
jgi:DNA-binding MarR family transcriptional regulator